MKKLILLLFLVFASCSTDCDKERAAIEAQYNSALQGSLSPEARAEIKRQRDRELSNLDC